MALHRTRAGERRWQIRTLLAARVGKLGRWVAGWAFEKLEENEFLPNSLPA